jgi:hypothetical protein
MDRKYGSPMVKDGAIGKGKNRVIAESLVNSKGTTSLIELVEYYLNELDRLENKGNTAKPRTGE